jgi:hypothetical protein
MLKSIYGVTPTPVEAEEIAAGFNVRLSPTYVQRIIDIASGAYDA